jgi:hypothetical protein
MSRSRALLHILNLQIRIIYVRLWLGELVVVVDCELLCLGWLVGMCSGARRIMSFMLGKKTYTIMSYLYVNMRSYKGSYSQGE